LKSLLGGNITLQSILSNVGGILKSDTKGLDNKALQKLNRGSNASIGPRSQTGRSQVSRGTKMTYNSRSRKSNQDYDIENIDPMTVQTVIDTGYSELKIQEDAKKKIERKKIQQS